MNLSFRSLSCRFSVASGSWRGCRTMASFPSAPPRRIRMSLLDTIDIETAPHPTATVLVLHGLGADGNDFVPIARELDLRAVGPMRFVFPHAPVMPVTINNGYRMRAWYDILGSELVRREDEAGLRSSMAAVRA